MAAKIPFEDIVHDGEKFQKFNTYLEEDGISFLLQFYGSIKSLRTQSYDSDTKTRVIRQIFKTFFRKREDIANFHSTELDLLKTQDGRSVRPLVDAVFELNKKSKNLPHDAYDEAFKWVDEILRITCFPNFLKSPIFFESLSAFENNLSEKCQQEEISNDFVKISQGRLPKIPENEPSNLLNVTALPPYENETPLPAAPVQPLFTKPEKTKNETWTKKEVLGSISVNPNVWDSLQSETKDFLKKESFPPVTEGLTYHPQMDLNRRDTSGGDTAGSRERTLQRNKKLSANAEIRNFGPIDTMPRMNPSHAAAPYNAMSSTINHVTRQNSALQSVVTDQSSTFSARSDPMREMRHHYKSERRQLKAGASTNDQQGRGAGLVGPFQPDASKALPETMKWASSKDPEMHRKFAKVLCKKLQDLVDKQEAVKVYAQRQKSFKDMLRRSYQDRMSNPSESLVGVDTEEDQHLLNEHERQVVDHEETEMELQNLSNHPIKYPRGRNSGEGQSTFSHTSINQQPVNQQGLLSQRTKSYEFGLDGRESVKPRKSSNIPNFGQFVDKFDSVRIENSQRTGSYDSMTLNSQHRSKQQRPMPDLPIQHHNYATLQPPQTRNLSQREAYEQQRMQSMQKAEHDRRKFYQDENNEGYPPQSGHHLQQPQAYHHSPYHQHPLRNNNQVQYEPSGFSTGRTYQPNSFPGNAPPLKNHQSNSSSGEIIANIKFYDEDMPYNVRLKYSGSHPVVTLGQLKREIPADPSKYSYYFQTTDGEYFAEDNDNGLLPILHGKDSKLIIRVQGKPPPQSKKAF